MGDMWRGPMWLNHNYMVTRALLLQKQVKAAAALLKASLDTVEEHYKNYGVIFEFYDSENTQDPRTLMRKGSPTGGVRDYHWSAALTLQMILDLSSLGDAAGLRYVDEDALHI